MYLITLSRLDVPDREIVATGDGRKKYIISATEGTCGQTVWIQGAIIRGMAFRPIHSRFTI
jgi:hypothetical protein